MIKPTLRLGSRGPAVVELQKGLNLMSSTLAPLATDGIYGSKSAARVQEFQRGQQLVPDGVTGPLTWDAFLTMLANIQKGIPPVPATPPGVPDPRRAMALIIAQQRFGAVDFQHMVGGRPKGIDFLKEMFQVAANVKLTDANFRQGGSGSWHWEPWVSHPNEQKKSWCGIFCVYCYKKAGFNVSWDLARGGPSGQVKLNQFSSSFVSNIRQADIGAVGTRNHHFLIESVDGSGPTPGLTTIDGNLTFGRIMRRQTHRVGKDNFNYYSVS
jgi:hypothetical protein